jgi:hypothetical protein
MDAPGATPANESAVQGTPEHSTSTARSRSPTDSTQDPQDRDQPDDDDNSNGSDPDEDDDENEEDESEDEEDEPRLKYAYLTKHLGSVYRNGDATSSFLVAGDKMVRIIGRHSGNLIANKLYRLSERTTETS